MIEFLSKKILIRKIKKVLKLILVHFKLAKKRFPNTDVIKKIIKYYMKYHGQK